MLHLLLFCLTCTFLDNLVSKKYPFITKCLDV